MGVKRVVFVDWWVETYSPIHNTNLNIVSINYLEHDMLILWSV